MIGMSGEELEEVVSIVRRALCDREVRALPQRAVQAKIWHEEPAVCAVLTRLRDEEDLVRRSIMALASKLVYRFHSVEATLARAGVLPRRADHSHFDAFCVDAKERLYLLLQTYGWLQEFFRLYPLHFYENSFQFVDRIPNKHLHSVTVAVVGLGIGGAMAVSGLAKAGIAHVVAYEKRDQRRVASRYQNSSWRAYDVAQRLLHHDAYQHLLQHQQKIRLSHDDGTESVFVSDRIQIILGSAIRSCIDSAKRYGADLRFGVDATHHFTNQLQQESDIVALFAGAHTSTLFHGLEDEMAFTSWPELDSRCKMWLQIRESGGDNTEPHTTTRHGEVGAERWHFTIQTARSSVNDLHRIRDNLRYQYNSTISNLQQQQTNNNDDDDADTNFVTMKFHSQLDRLAKIQKAVDEGTAANGCFDYIFTNAPDNEHNLLKRHALNHHPHDHEGSVVIDGDYTVPLRIASNSTVRSGPLLDELKTKLIVCGGDACVPPNPMAAYGATLACEAANMLVQLAIGTAHLNAILMDMEGGDMLEFLTPTTLNGGECNDTNDGSTADYHRYWMEQVKSLRSLLALYYDARMRSENYFQFVQTLICNLYSLPPLDT